MRKADLSGAVLCWVKLSHADHDIVRPGTHSNTLRLAARLQEAGGRAETRLYDGLGHIRLAAALAAPLRRLTAPVLNDIDGFLQEIAAEPHDRC